VIPQSVTEALARLAEDRSDLDGKYGEKSQADATLATAQNNAATAASTLSAGVSKFEADKAALVELINNTFNSGPPAPGGATA
jgi:transaldolase